MNNLSRHRTVSALSQEGSSDQENVDLTVTSPDISDPQIFMITEAISRSLQSSFKGLENTLGSLSKDIHKLASDSSSKHLPYRALFIRRQNMPNTRPMLEYPLPHPEVLA